MKLPVLTDMRAVAGRLAPSLDRIRFFRETAARLSSLLTDVSILQRWLMDLSRCV